jgi:2',3'-cyclic-nucleotide 2'-phosphodiesterase/3'-nucleotidase/5'-nucleotidase
MASSHYTTYCNFSQDKKTKTQENMVIAFGKIPVNTMSGIVPVFEAAVQEAKSFQGSGNTGGSGGGGGGGAGGTGGSGSSASSGIPDGKGGLDVTSTTNILQPAKPFADLGSVNWAEEAIVALNKKNVISGMGDGKFCPQESVTREQMVKMILLASGFSATEVDSGFEDVMPGAWYAPYVGNAVKQGIVAGIDSTHFGVGQNITRQDAAVMINRAMKIINKTKSNVRSYIDFADKAEIADYAEEAIKNLYVTGVINGKENHTFAPKATCTRAEAAKMIYDAFIK